MGSVKGKNKRKRLYFHRTVVILSPQDGNHRDFFLIFPLMDSMVGHFIDYSLGIFEKNKASTISCDTASNKRDALPRTVPCPRNPPTPMSRTLTEQGFDKLERLGRGRDRGWGREGEAFLQKGSSSLPQLTALEKQACPLLGFLPEKT